MYTKYLLNKKKEYARTAYLNKKAKLQKLKEINTLEIL